MTHIVFTAFSNRQDALGLARDIGSELEQDGATSSVHLLDGPLLPVLDSTSLVVSLGGDGTFLRSARLAHGAGARVVAVNLGQVGFLLNVASTEVAAHVRRALSSEVVDERLALSITRSGSIAEDFALNEVVVERASPGHMVKVRTYVDGDEYLTYSADGVMVATATGSTGYNFSAGGPVVEASLALMILTPIAPHFTIDRSIVVSATSLVRLEVVDNPAELVADGVSIATIQPGDGVEVRRNPSPVRVVATGSFDLSARLRRSLREGHA